jgi:hypothetical protein
MYQHPIIGLALIADLRRAADGASVASRRGGRPHTRRRDRQRPSAPPRVAPRPRPTYPLT